MGGDTFRVFAIGLNKTGTSSVREALVLLGVQPIPSAQAVVREGLVDAVLRDGDRERALAFARRYRVLGDRPWNVGDMYRRLHERFPDSRFVLTVRDEESWWRSVSHWVEHKPHMRDVYALHLGGGVFERERFLAHYRAYREEVLGYFREVAPDRLLVMDPERGDGWDLLCPFLGVSIPSRPFPHANRQRYLEQAPLRPQRGRCSACGEPLEARRRVEPSPRVPTGGDLRRRLRAARASWDRMLDAAAAQAERRALDPARLEQRFARLRARNPSLAIDDVAAVCCFFDPGDSGSRVEHYRRFQAGIARAGVPLLTVELAFADRPFQLDADERSSLRLRTDTVLWHKERLLNLGIGELLRRGYRKIAWLDADIHFADDRWPWHVAHSLETARVVQVFDRVSVQHGPTGPPTRGLSSVRYYRSWGRLDGQRGRRRWWRRRGPPGCSGYGWAARAEVLEKVLLYDAAVAGGADKLIDLAGLPRSADWHAAVARWFESSQPACPACGHRNQAPAWHAHYLAWAERWHDVVAGRVGFVETAISDSFHGSRARRASRTRHEILLRQGFDPARDLRTRPDGTLEWASDKPGMHADVTRYLRSREGYA
jgi:hypothetical protein